MVDRTSGKYQGVVVHNFATEDEAVRAIRELQAAGFGNDEISVIAQDRDVASGVAEDTDTRAPEGAAAGAVTGGALGALAALIAGATTVAIPGIGIAIGGPIAAAIAGAAGGGLIGGLVGMGIPENEAKEYESYVQRGDILVTVVAGSREAEARAILKSGTFGTAGRDVTGYTTTDSAEITRPS
jgi:hypothetical protein